MNNPLAGVVEHWLAREGHTLLNRSSPASAVRVRLASTRTVFLADVAFGDESLPVAIKQLPANAVIADPAALCRIHRAIRSQSPLLSRALPAFLGYEPEARLIAMEFVSGQTLRDQLWKGLWLPGWGEQRQRHWLAQAGEILATLHGLAPEEVGAPSHDRANRFFMAALEEGWTDPRLRSYLPQEFRDPEHLYRLLPDDFFDRHDDHVAPVDGQAKNTLVSGSGNVAFIDMDYLGGSRAVSLAHYLVSFDRIGLRHPFAWHSRRLAAWKQCFLEHYARFRPDVVGDLLFFYPWAIIKNFQQQIAYRPRSAWYLGRYYGSYLRAFLVKAVHHAGKSTVDRNLFSSLNPVR